MNIFRKSAKPVRRLTSTPPDCVIWAVGDVHGRLDVLAPLVKTIARDLGESPKQRKVVIFLGDYVDRGPNSQGVIALLERLPRALPFEFHFLRGNHEDRMAAFLDNPGLGPGWCDYGGRETPLSYGLEVSTQSDDLNVWAETSRALSDAMGPGQRSFFERLESFVSIGGYFFAHAGAKPGVPLDRQSAHDLMWVRRTFLNDASMFDRMVVHGHTPAQEVHTDQRRIGLDTGAYATGVLSALRLEDDRREVLQTTVSGDGVKLARRGL